MANVFPFRRVISILKGLNVFIKRLEDKNFMVTLTEEEALKITDAKESNFEYCRLLSRIIGSKLLYYMMQASEFPHDSQPTLEVEL